MREKCHLPLETRGSTPDSPEPATLCLPGEMHRDAVSSRAALKVTALLFELISVFHIHFPLVYQLVFI